MSITGFHHGWELSLRWTFESLSACKPEKEKIWKILSTSRTHDSNRLNLIMTFWYPQKLVMFRANYTSNGSMELMNGWQLGGKGRNQNVVVRYL